MPKSQTVRKAAAPKRARPAAKPSAKARKDGAAAKRAPPPDSARVDFAGLTLKDALDLAILVEQEAEERYQKLAQMVGGRYAGDAGDVFRKMAKNEARHGAELTERRQRLFKRAKRTISLDALNEVEAPDFTKVNVFMSPRQAMEVAIEDEEKAYDFYDQALPHLKDAAVRKLFQELRGEERRHKQLLEKKVGALPTGPDVDEELADDPGSDPG